ncbi:Hsp20/alpha crystallin family protein [Aquibacillus kalidii]|uniref:Hsp20/alpha crystallin family protein n=1 Tax=Aquibacillus kalidii TaxID=2762597 RepID=UPI00164644A9|nr:Hsp20/alpha crystallin family protein [Aquibacillus kalidii]
MEENSKYSKKKNSNSQDTGADLMRKMDEFFHSKPTKNFLNTIDSFFQNTPAANRIPVDVYETDEEWVVKVDLPGLKKEDIAIDVVGDRVKIQISDDSDMKKYDENYNFYHRERRYRHSERTVQLPYAVDKRTAKARYVNGVLKIHGPKKPRADYQLDIE